MGASLPPKEANLFKLIVVSPDSLSLFVPIGVSIETLSMKGLTLNCMDRKSEAYELVRLGLKNDLKSHVCWHVYGLLYRSDREYREAIKCYRNALKIDPDNIEILRDLSLLQISLLEECGSLERALEELHKKGSKIVDKLAYKEQEVSLLVKLGRLEEAAELYRVLLAMNPDNYRTDKEPPSTLMWTLFFLAQHYDRRRQYEIALTKIDEAIEHTPTVIDLYSVKIFDAGMSEPILKHAGDLAAASALADEARCMDLADRYINSECVKRMLQADQVVLAEKTALLFTKDGDQHNNLHDMQCMYELASGESYFRQGDLGRALKKFLAVEKHYADITEDQFDFHSYCLRKMTLRAYVAMLKFQDSASKKELESQIRSQMIGVLMSTESGSGMMLLFELCWKFHCIKDVWWFSKKEAEVKNEESSASGVSKSGKRHVKPADPDPNGEKLLQVEDPLLEATKYLKLLQKNSSDSLETHLLSFEVNMRKQKILLALQAVKQLLRLDAENPDSHCCLIRFFHKVGSMTAPVMDTEKLIWRVLEAERPSISELHEKSLIEANKFFLEKHKDSLMHRAAVAEMQYVLEPNKKSDAIKLIEDSANNLVPVNGALGPVKGWKLKDCIAVHKLLETALTDHDAASRWKVRCADYFPYSTYFEGKCSSAMPNSVYNQIGKNHENGSASLPGGGKIADSVASNGKLEAFKELTI
ncbi:hypothetical protein GH714_034540 [Hevea brasiliensis]|uniref:Uncharacterized protein n=1 Tax=Hevea brasiliensis TaxID=3981 RepID=A0A6A6NDN4_HEVBR|nr:hypothetical protein GH714_034540 [Hevea brasiliensis]